MRSLVVYDSQFGNTEKVAQAMADALGCQALPAGAVTAEQLRGLDLLVVGSPTQRFTSTPASTRFVKDLVKGSLNGMKIAAFDTRFTVENIDRIKILAFFVRMFGYAAEPLAKRLQQAGGDLAADPEGFYVADSEGPLLEGELERAAKWAVSLAE